METSTPYTITTLKKQLALALKNSQYDLLSPEVLTLSKMLDVLMNPIFEGQLQNLKVETIM